MSVKLRAKATGAEKLMVLAEARTRAILAKPAEAPLGYTVTGDWESAVRFNA